MSFSQALSGLAAQSDNLKVISNNIANSQTVGFKSGNTVFADVFAGATSKVGLGTSVAAITQDFTSGDLENTGRNLDLAVAGEGFYRLEQPNGEVVFSRNGQFNQDADGFLVNATGQLLTGSPLNENIQEDTAAQLAFPFSNLVKGGAPQPIFVSTQGMPAKATSEVSSAYNLDASIDPTNNDLISQATVDDGTDDGLEVDYHYSSTFSVYDSLGNARNITTYFQKTGDNAWSATAYMDGKTSLGNVSYNIAFDNKGKITAPGTNDDDFLTPLAFNPDGGALPLTIDLKLAGTTQFASNSVQSSLSQNGFPSGALVGITIEEDGRVMRNFSNEQSAVSGQIALVTFANKEGLQPDGDNAWRATNASGEPVIGIAGTGMFGTIAAGVLENSNVDLAKQLVDMIVAQRAYQANSSSISTQDELLQTVIQL
ncbi:flagellar hook protein FlgE [Halomonas sp.]|uniref:flagellar hook protein FlgE n=1 Tax=Halomonas sp. TaxID=1486246 RepID=UPI00384BF30C